MHEVPHDFIKLPGAQHVLGQVSAIPHSPSSREQCWSVYLWDAASRLEKATKAGTAKSAVVYVAKAFGKGVSGTPESVLVRAGRSSLTGRSCSLQDACFLHFTLPGASADLALRTVLAKLRLCTRKAAMQRVVTCNHRSRQGAGKLPLVSQAPIPCMPVCVCVRIVPSLRQRYRKT